LGWNVFADKPLHGICFPGQCITIVDSPSFRFYRTFLQFSTTPSQKSSTSTAHINRRFEQVEIELNRTQDLLRQSQRNHDAAEQELHCVSAAKELSDFQLSLLMTKNENGHNQSTVDLDTLQKAFLGRAKRYEAEMGQLRRALQEAESKVTRLVESGPTMEEEEDGDESAEMVNAQRGLREDRDRLLSIRTALSRTDPVNMGNSTERTAIAMPPSVELTEDDIEAEEQAKQASLETLTNKYSQNDEGGSTTEPTMSVLRRNKFQAEIDKLSRSMHFQQHPRQFREQPAASANLRSLTRRRTDEMANCKASYATSSAMGDGVSVFDSVVASASRMARS
jgi:hypothetical protein